MVQWRSVHYSNATRIPVANIEHKPCVQPDSVHSSQGVRHGRHRRHCELCEQPIDESIAACVRSEEPFNEEYRGIPWIDLERAEIAPLSLAEGATATHLKKMR